MSQHSHWSSIIAALGLLAGLSGCGDDSDTGGKSDTRSPVGDGGEGTPGPNVPGTGTATKDPLVIVAERKSVETPLHYLHVLPDWPADGKLDFRTSVELGDPGVAHVEGDQFFFWQGKAARFQKLTIDDALRVRKAREDQISFMDYAIVDFTAEAIYASAELAFIVDEQSQQVVRFNPSALRIEQAYPVSQAVLMRGGLKGSFQLGLAANDLLYTTTNWYDYKGKGAEGVAIGVFDQSDPAEGPRLVEDPRCAPAVATGVWQDDEFVYVASDSANGFGVFADPVKPNPLPQCVLRMRKGGTAFEQDYLIDLQKVTGSPGIRMSWPMKDNKLLVNLWSPDPAFDPAKIIEPGDDSTFWNAEAWAFAVVDLTTRTSKMITDIPPSKQESRKLLEVDGETYLQVYRADRSSIVYRVNPDATVVQVLELEGGADVQYLGRLKPARRAD